MIIACDVCDLCDDGWGSYMYERSFVMVALIRERSFSQKKAVK